MEGEKEREEGVGDGASQRGEVKQKKKGAEERESTRGHNTRWHGCRGRREAGRMKVKWALGTPRPNTLLPSPLPFQVMSHLLLL